MTRCEYGSGKRANATTEQLKNLIEASVIDPAEVTRTALAERSLDRQKHCRPGAGHTISNSERFLNISTFLLSGGLCKSQKLKS